MIYGLVSQSLPQHSPQNNDDEASETHSEDISKTSDGSPPGNPVDTNAGGSGSSTPIAEPVVPNYGSTSESHAALQGDTSSSPTAISDEAEPISGFTAPPGRNAPPRPSAFRIMTDPIVRTVLLSYFCLALISTANDVIFALWMYLSIEDGGVGLKVSHLILYRAPQSNIFTTDLAFSTYDQPTQIATALSAGSILQTLIIVFLFPLLHRRFGTLLIYRSAMALDVVLIACYPVVHLIAQRSVKHHHGEHDDDIIQTALSVASLLVGRESEKERGGIIGVWNGVPGGLVAGIATMLVVKAFAGLTWG